jgi:CRP/FNR family transcriptional regulator, cyclic AMP receptor protein
MAVTFGPATRATSLQRGANVTESELWFLQRFRLLESLNDDQRETIRKAITISELKRGSRIYLPGDPAEHIYLLRFGVVKLGTPTPDGGMLILTFLYTGDLFGESAVIEDLPRDHVAEAHEDSIICSVPREPLLRIMHETPDFGCQLTKLMAVRLRMFKTRVEQLLHRSAQARIAHTLLTLGQQFGAQVGPGLVIPLRLSQRDLASLVGVRRETVNLVLQNFRQRGLVEAQRRRIVVQNPVALAAVC